MEVQRLLQDRANQYGQKPAIIFNGQTVSFAGLHDHVLKLTHALSALGVSKGDKIAIYLPNCPEYVYSYLAVFCLGAVGVPLDFMLKGEELVSCLNHSETKVLIAAVRQEVSLEVIQRAVPSLKKIILCQGQMHGALRYHDLAADTKAGLPRQIVAQSDPALIMYTSGTTGNPKGVLLNYQHLEGSPKAMEYFVDLTDRDVKLCALPLSHIGGFIYIQNCLMFGITVVLMERFNPFEFLRNIAQYKVTCFHIVPPMYTALLSMKEIEKFDLSSLRWVVVFGAPSSPETLRRFHQYCPNAHFLNGWGMTETCPPNTVTPLGSDRIESVGKPSPLNEIKIYDEDDKEVPAGGVGEIVIKGWVVMDGYYKDPETTNTLKRNGWFHTGDLGRFDKEGFLYIVGRKKEMIKVGGQIVYAPEVEAALQRHPAVSEVAVIGVPDELRGEAIKAFVVLREKESIGSDELKYFVREHLAHFKIPHTIEILENLPKNRTGKIDKEELRKTALSQLQSS